jgi:ketosteroid isomerase-like protein
MSIPRDRAVAVLAAALLIPLTGRAGRVSSGRREEPEGQKAAVADTIRQLFRAAEERRLDRVEALHSYGPEFSKFDEFGLGREDAAQTREAERRSLASVKSLRASVRDLKVDLLGEAALATFILDYTAETTQGLAAATLRSTVVPRSDRGRWLVVHEHYSPLVLVAGQPAQAVGQPDADRPITRNETLRQELLEMAKVDQELRFQHIGEQPANSNAARAQELEAKVEEADRAHTRRMEEIGRVLVAEGKPQLYGSQTTIENGVIRIRPTSGEATLDERRARLGLPPMPEHLKLLEEMYHLPVVE